MAASLTTRHKIFLLFLSIILTLTLVSRVWYSKHLHGLLCAARTFHHYAISDTPAATDVESNGYLPALAAEVEESKEDVAGKITDIKNRIRQQRIMEEKKALEQGVMSRQMKKRLKKQKTSSPRLADTTRKLPQAIIIGVRKCGTRALLEMLENHPQIAACGPEVHFFDKNYDRGLDWYRRQMQPSLPGQITIEKTPSYFITETAPEDIHAMNKDVKLLVIVRDPTTRVISDYTQIMSKGVSKMVGMSFEETVMSEGEVRTSYKAIQISMYSKHLERWLKYFPLRQMHFVDGDKLITDPLPEMKKVEQFLGIPDFITSDNFYFNATSGFYCLAGDRNSKCLAPSKGREHPKVSPEVIQKLQEFFRPYNEQFFTMINQHFDWP
ncbi:heparan sulfate glucosamine 3-O-sulfotransferase 1-like [Acanthaster planci]|uniref:Heparan sulfate glucosamine 3-O-sulfotransferase 5 n=1 Tax=Acanthaster planci TaxID=133434 RepID=A0A8B7Y9T1_ACAPL|nr:heparan sulfate glucosamine 3-O-sulfotransferase 1-like [Acanthaster planci]